jgi:ribosome-binding protein aMBF1 (putative translation factor)
VPLPRVLFNKDYPTNPRNFGERLRKARMDAGMQIKDLASVIGVTPDTVINWELRGMKPMKRKVREKLCQFIEI